MGNNRQLMFGREPELRQANEGLAEALAGRGSVILVAGEPGVGKTRFAREIVETAKAQGVLAFECLCEEGSRTLWLGETFANLFLDLWGPSGSPAASKARLRAVGVSDSEMILLLGGRLNASGRRQFVDPEDAATLRGIASDLLKLRDGAMSDSPTVLLLDNVQNLHPLSVRLLAELSSQLQTRPLLIVATTRTTTSAARDLANTLHGARVLDLWPLDGDTLRQWLRSVGLPDNSRLVADLRQRTAGVALLVESCISALRAAYGSDPPPTVYWDSLGLGAEANVMLDRLVQTLNPQTANALSIGAVIAKFAEHSWVENWILADILQLTESELEVAIEPGRRINVVEPAGIGRFEFRHDMWREALYRRLGADASRVHALVANTLGGTSRAAEVFHHNFQAATRERQDTTVASALVYIAWLMERGHVLEAVRITDAVLDLPYLVALAPHSRYDLLISRGRAQWMAGRFQAAIASLEAAAACALVNEDYEGYGRAWAERLDVWDEYTSDFSGPSQTRERDIVRVIQSTFDPGVKARLLAWRGRDLSWSGNIKQGAQLGQEAYDIAHAVGDPGLVCRVLNVRLEILWPPYLRHDRLILADEAEDAARQAFDSSDALELMWFALSRKLLNALEGGEIREARALVRRKEQIAQELGHRAYILASRAAQNLLALLAGHYEEAESLAKGFLDEGLEVLGVTALQIYKAQQYVLLRDKGKLETVSDEIRTLAADLKDVRAWRCALIWLQSLLPSSNKKQLKKSLKSLVREIALKDRWYSSRLWLAEMAMLSEASALLVEAEDAACLYEGLVAHRGLHVVAGWPAAYLGPVDYYLGRLAAVMPGSKRVADEHFSHATQQATAMEATPWVIRTKFEWAHTLLAANTSRSTADERTRNYMGDSVPMNKGRTLLREALEGAEEIGMTDIAPKSEQLNLTFALANRPAVRLTPAQGAVVWYFFGENLAKDEVMERLRISFTTLKSHLDNAYDQMGISGQSREKRATHFFWHELTDADRRALEAIAHRQCALLTESN